MHTIQSTPCMCAMDHFEVKFRFVQNQRVQGAVFLHRGYMRAIQGHTLSQVASRHESLMIFKAHRSLFNMHTEIDFVNQKVNKMVGILLEMSILASFLWSLYVVEF